LANLSLPAQDSVAAQRELFRRAAKKGLTIAVLNARDSNLKTSTLKGWASGQTAMPAWAIGALGEAGVPDHLLTLVTDPFGRCVVSKDQGEGDLDAAAQDAIEFVGALARARSPSSLGGCAIVPQEMAVIVPLKERAQASMLKVRA
jgi:hypothetical protein